MSAAGTGTRQDTTKLEHKFTVTQSRFTKMVFAFCRAHGDGVCYTNTSGKLSNFADAVIFSTVTQTTIGYGNLAINECWTGAWLLVLQVIHDKFMSFTRENCLHGYVLCGTMFRPRVCVLIAISRSYMTLTQRMQGTCPDLTRQWSYVWYMLACALEHKGGQCDDAV